VEAGFVHAVLDLSFGLYLPPGSGIEKFIPGFRSSSHVESAGCSA